jgi:hypothetical protein
MMMMMKFIRPVLNVEGVEAWRLVRTYGVSHVSNESCALHVSSVRTGEWTLLEY